MNYYIADWHYGHKNIIAYDDRPFKTVEDMNEALIKNWNNAVPKSATVYILGDMFWCSTKEAIPILDKLNGKKVLIRGNHDKTGNKDFASRFENIVDYMEINDEGKHIVLCHYPIPCFNNHLNKWYHLYGHVHTTFEYDMTSYIKHLMNTMYQKPCNMYNVGVMMPYMNYTPRTFKEILETNGETNIKATEEGKE